MNLPKYLRMTRLERRATALLSGLIFCFFVVAWIWGEVEAERVELHVGAAEIVAFERQLAAADSARAAKYAAAYPKKSWGASGQKKTPFAYAAKRRDSFPKSMLRPVDFDPNTVDSMALYDMGLSRGVVRSIVNYRSRGGRYRSKLDLKKIYALDEATYAKLEPHILLPDSVVVGQDRPKWQKKEAALVVDINTATMADFEALPGIGAGWAGRIIKYRHNLGGFVRVEQIAEVYNFPDSLYQLIKPQLWVSETSPRVERLNLNTATYEELTKHPYLSGYQARAILRERERQREGRFVATSYVLTIPELDDQKKTGQRLLPYLRLE